MAGAISLSVVNNYLLPDVLFDLPRKVGLAFDLSAISSGIYGAILVVVMLLRPEGLVPARRTVQRGPRVGEAQFAETLRTRSSTASARGIVERSRDGFARTFDRRPG